MNSEVRYEFPKGFWWGAATSAAQSEGASNEDGKSPHIYDQWYAEAPERFFNLIGPKDTSTFYKNYKSDIAIMKQLGFNSFRTSISWSRLIPEGTGAVNPLAVDFYSNVIDELLANNIEPIINLFHFDMPMCMQELGGWESREVVTAFADYAETCFKLFGHKVKHWFTHNEPIVPVEAGYLYDLMYPNVTDFKRAAQVAYHSMLANACAIERFRKLEQPGKIGIILNMCMTYPRSDSPQDQEAAKIADLIHTRAFLDPAIKGEYPQELVNLLKEHEMLPEFQPEDLEIIKHNTIDTLGFNYYLPRRVKARETDVAKDEPFMPTRFFDHYEMPGRRMNEHRGWEIFEKGIYDMLIDLRDNYNNIEVFIGENGMGVSNEVDHMDGNGQVQDDYRIEFVTEHLKWAHKALEEGCNLLGFHLWTFIDCWSWANAYKNRYGLVSLDLETQKRSIKKSGYWFREIATSGTLVDHTEA